MTRHLYILFLLCMPLVVYAWKPMQRTYHDELHLLNDSIAILPNTNYISKAKSIEIRASIPSAKNLHGVSADCMGVVWSVVDSSNYYYATLTPSDDDSYEAVFDSRCVILEIGHQMGLTRNVLWSKTLTKDISMLDGENSLAAEIDCTNGEVLVYAGDKALKQVAALSVDASLVNGALGVMSRGKIDVSMIVTEQIPDMSKTLSSEWTLTSVADFVRSHPEDELLGIWKYLDRDNDSRYSRLCGDYQVAIVPDSIGGYLIIYLGGAAVGADQWKEGMIKGRLTPTQFDNHYDLVWYDATMQTIDKECSATLSQMSILTLDFPLIKMSMRFAKMPIDKKSK